MYASSSKAAQGRTEWDVLKENHRFIRDDEDAADVSWEERLARAYESKLFKEYALVDLKHYKSAKIALRWRTAPEVVKGIGESTCASLRCHHHTPPESDRLRYKDEEEAFMPELMAFELPFVYSEGGERKEALVKVKVCRKCSKKLLWGHGQGNDILHRKRREDKSKRPRQLSENEDGDGKKRRSQRSRSR